MSGSLMDFTITPPKRGIGLLLSVLKPLACVLGPLTVPTIIASSGCTTLFWCILGIHPSPVSSFYFRCSEGQGLDRISQNQPMWQIRCLIKVSSTLLVWSGHLCLQTLSEIFSVCLFVLELLRNLLLGHFSLVRF
ncbi:hypothetical protein AVEN_73057-1 [Araneus ventricosus]|uniref:Uncharacterized protein n=1 Tax=Araneus ventricosus TaxID=182803 RepID=A0A4Y2TE26_ARAVE|nr:hypothetical protein AVEN_73057-1 [Araneus ventricosus]